MNEETRRVRGFGTPNVTVDLRDCQPAPLTEEEKRYSGRGDRYKRPTPRPGASLPARVTEEQHQAAFREVLDFMPHPDNPGDRREAEAIVDRVLACLRPPTEPEEKR